MTKNKLQQTDTTRLRRRAEDRFGEKNEPTRLFGTGEDTLRLLHELQVHRIELEMQNAELRQTIDEREEAEILLGKFTDLYDFAPVGYMTLARNGTIRAVNLTGAVLVGAERSRLIGMHFYHFVADNHISSFNTFIDSVFDNQGKQTGEMILLKEGGHPFFVRLEAAATESGKECRLVIIDISELKQVQEELSLKIIQLETAMAKVKQLEGIIPICCYCHKIRDDTESWQHMEKYITDHSEALFSHGVCPECSEHVMKGYKIRTHSNKEGEFLAYNG